MNRVLIGLIALASCAIFAQEGAGPATQPTSQPAVTPADKLLDQMLRGSGPVAKPLQPIDNPPIYDQTAGKTVAPSPTTMQSLIREGDYIRDRTGRLQRSADGQNFEFVFDADGRSMQDPPVAILPNLKLMAMENAVSAANRDLRFRITGPVTEYKGRNYVLLEKVVVIPDITGRL
jgi:predicted component of type VI protein secretion system